MTHSDKSQKNWSFTSLENDSLYFKTFNSPKKKLQLTHFDSPNFSRSKENLEKIRKNEFSDFERWG